MAYSQALSGLSAASQDLDVIGNNISNANTVGYKQSQAQFAEMYANAMNTSTNNQAGIGTSVAKIGQNFTQGTITETGQTLDMAINGNGFFTLSNNGAAQYSRNGQFTLDKDGNIVNAQGSKLMGYAADKKGTLNTSTPVALTIPSGSVDPKMSTKVTAEANLNSASHVPKNMQFDPSDTSSYNNATTAQVFDSLGNVHTLNMYYQKTSNEASTWNVYATMDGKAVGGTNTAGLPKPVDHLAFDTSGALVSGKDANVKLQLENGATATQPLKLDFSKMTQFGADFVATSVTSDGYAAGSLSSFGVDNAGKLTGTYSNGQSMVLGQVALTSFANAEGLQNLGNNMFAQSSTSGQPQTGVAGTGPLGNLKSGATEAANVDLTSSLVELITAQRYYQANAQTIKTQQAVDQTLMNL
ncbi:flagellar hook protein FlgE [Robbsia sp. KACC 23696]|uniref:flagellar hook protein FlgE n=1 Tax=Robbsia sp. KACC 23696 TaxID=3149231 RepID=UPI00325B7A0F